MKVVFRCDASTTIGTGHVMRCLTLAEALREKGAEVSFVSRENPGHFCEFINKSGYVVNSLPPILSIKELAPEHTYEHYWQVDADETKSILNNGYNVEIDWLIIDNYSLDIKWEKTLRPYVKKIMVIDDLANRLHDCDILLDQDYFINSETRYKELVPSYCKKLLGPQYALLRSEFASARKTLRLRDGNIERILVFFGGSDLTNETVKVLEAIKMSNRLDIFIDVVVGSNNLHKHEIREVCMDIPNAHFHFQVSNMAYLMSKADLAIGAGGSTTWERCCVGLPSIVVPIAKNQVKSMEELALIGIIELYTDDKTTAGYFLVLQDFLMHKKPIENMIKKCLDLCDGKGVQRVVGNMLVGDVDGFS